MAIPIAGVWLGYVQKDKELQKSYVELGIHVLSDPPKAEAESLRRWAVKLINANSKVKLDKDAEDEVVNKVPLTEASAASYLGVERAAAKLSIGNGPLKDFADVTSLLAFLPPDERMRKRNPPITRDSPRVPEEEQNVRLHGFLYAAKRELSNDYHLILGGDPVTAPETFMTAVIVGLPAPTSSAYSELQRVRDGFIAALGDRASGTRYAEFEHPIPVEVQGSLYFDISHLANITGPGRIRGKIRTQWQIRPVTVISLK